MKVRKIKGINVGKQEIKHHYGILIYLEENQVPNYSNE
jgi:hypothetical protein